MLTRIKNIALSLILIGNLLGLSNASAASLHYDDAPEKWIKDILSLGVMPVYPLAEEIKPGDVYLMTHDPGFFCYYYRIGGLYKGMPLPILGPFPFPIAPIWGEWFHYIHDNGNFRRPEVITLGSIPKFDTLVQDHLDNEKVINSQPGSDNLFETYENQIKAVYKLIDTKFPLAYENLAILKDSAGTALSQGNFLQDFKTIRDNNPGNKIDTELQSVADNLKNSFNAICKYGVITDPIIAPPPALSISGFPAIAALPPNPTPVQKMQTILDAIDATSKYIDTNYSIPGPLVSPINIAYGIKLKAKLVDFKSLVKVWQDAANTISLIRSGKNSLYVFSPARMRQRTFPAFTLRHYTLGSVSAFLPVGGSLSGLNSQGIIGSDDLVNINVSDAVMAEVPIDELKATIKNNAAAGTGSHIEFGNGEVVFDPKPFLQPLIDADPYYKKIKAGNKSKNFLVMIPRQIIYIRKATITLAHDHFIKTNASAGLFKGSPATIPANTNNSTPNVYNFFGPTGAYQPSPQSFTANGPSISLANETGGGTQSSISLGQDAPLSQPLAFAMRPLYIKVIYTPASGPAKVESYKVKDIYYGLGGWDY